MKKIRNNHYTRAGVFMLVVTVLFVLFIFSRSAIPSETSAVESGSIVTMFGGFFEQAGIDSDTADHIVRKTAHFIEFLALGVLLTLCVCFNSKRKIKPHIFTILFFAVFIPMCDEGIQYFSPGRAPEVRDIFLDFSGALTGIFIVLAILKISLVIKKKKKEKLDF